MTDKQKILFDMYMALGMVSDISDIQLENLTHGQLINVVKDVRSESRKALAAAKAEAV